LIVPPYDWTFRVFYHLTLPNVNDTNFHSKQKSAVKALFAACLIAVLTGAEAVAAVHRALASGLEGNTGLRTALSTRRLKHRAVASPLLFLRGTALGTPFGDVLEALLLVELLFGSGEYKFTTAIRTRQRSVFKHFFSFFVSMVSKTR
jgi:hypothetical protein